MDSETVAQKTGDALDKRGFCFWKCATLDGEIIAVIKNGQNTFFKDRAKERATQLIKDGKLSKMPVIYTVEELQILADSLTPKLIHESKKWDSEGTIVPTEN